jgi:hypothetical protein
MQNRIEVDSRKICDNIPYIKNVFLNLLKIQLDDELNFKQGASGDDEIYVHINGCDFKLIYNELKDIYAVLHFNTRGNNNAIHYHSQFESDSIILCIKRLGTCHSPKDINEKSKNKVDKMFDKIKNPPKITLK